MKNLKIFLILLICSILFTTGMMLLFWKLADVANRIQKEKNIKELRMTKEEYFEKKINNRNISDNIALCSKLFDLPYELIMSISWHESCHNAKAISLKNKNGSVDIGVMQLNSYTFKEFTLQQLFDAELNILNGSKHLKMLMDKYNKNVVKSLCAYNCGERAVDKNYYPASTIEYVNKIINYQNKLEKEYIIYYNTGIVEENKT